jgi:hypothetical protein
VVRRLDRLELFGADVSAASKRQHLSVAYVTLGVSCSEKTRGQEEIEGTDEDTEITLPADEALAGSARWIVRGPAGSGKTTLLKWVAVQSASRSFQGDLAEWNNSVPFFIRLRQCVESGLSAPEGFPQLVAPSVSGEMPDGWVHEQLRSGRAIVLIDGVDEVPQLQRDEVREWIAGLVGAFSRSRFLVSSRPHAIDEGWMTGEDFDDALLQEMDLRQIDAFVEHWHKAVQEDLLDPDEAAEMNDLAAHLQTELRSKRSLRNLATNPLLCALICALHRDRNQQLPADRIELYEAGVYMLLERREVERRVPLGDYPDLSYRKKRDLLEDLAYWMLQNGYTMVTQEQVDARLERALQYVVGLEEGVTPEQVRSLFVERSGLLSEPLSGQFNFAHRTFQEFLAAQAALDEGDVGVLIGHAHDDQWRQVILAAAGLGSKRVRNELIGGLIARGDREEEHRHAIHLLAVACLETATGLDPEVRGEVQARLEDLVPPKNLTEAAALASAGELAVPYLGYDAMLKASVAAACVRALSTIGGEAALTALEGYAGDARKTVGKELLKAWDSFDREEYVRRIPIASRLDVQEMVYISGLEGLRYLSPEKLDSCANLRVSRLPQVSDLSPLAGLANLSSVRLIHMPRDIQIPPQLRERCRILRI